MGKGLHIVFIGAAIAAYIIVASPQAHATLGEPADSIENDSHALSAKHMATTVRKNYTIREIASPTTTVREYISPSGVVFGIAWDGLTYPDLTQLLGSYDKQYRKAMKQTPRKHGQRSLQITAADLVVQKWGHIRNLQGRAYAPSLIPQGVTPDEIR